MILTRKELNRTPCEAIVRVGSVTIYSDESGAYFEVYKASPNGFLVTGGW